MCVSDSPSRIRDSSTTRPLFSTCSSDTDPVHDSGRLQRVGLPEEVSSLCVAVPDGDHTGREPLHVFIPGRVNFGQEFQYYWKDPFPLMGRVSSSFLSFRVSKRKELISLYLVRDLSWVSISSDRFRRLYFYGTYLFLLYRRSSSSLWIPTRFVFSVELLT